MPGAVGGDVRPTFWPGGDAFPRGESLPICVPGGEFPANREDGRESM